MTTRSRIFTCLLFACSCITVYAPLVHGQDTENAVPIITGSISQCSCNGNTVGNGCLVQGGNLCPPNCTPAGQKPSDACQPSGPVCNRPPAVRLCDAQIPGGLYRLKLDMKLDDGEQDCLNSRTQDPHHRLQQIGCTAHVVQSTFFFDRKDAQGCYTLRPYGQSANTVLGILVDGDDKYIAEMGEKPNCPSGADQYHWNLVPRDTPLGKRYLIQNKLTGQCINADTYTAHGGGKVQPLTCVGDPHNPADLFQLEKVQ